MRKKPRKIKIILILAAVLTLSAVTAIFVGYRKFADQPGLLLDALRDKADLSLGSIHHTATRDGVKEWTLTAKSANLVGSEKAVFLEDLSIIYHLKNGNEVNITARQGILNTESNDIEVTGNVVLISEPYEMKTERMVYRHKGRRVYSTAPVRIMSLKSYIAAQTMSFDLNSQMAQFAGNVEGIFAEDVQL